MRAAADHLMRMGMETDNGKDIAEGAKIRIKLDRLDQPENENVSINDAIFLPPVVVTDIREVDPTKEPCDDAEVARILAKYGGYIDEKRLLVEEKVRRMEVVSEIEREEPALPSGEPSGTVTEAGGSGTEEPAGETAGAVTEGTVIEIREDEQDRDRLDEE